MSDKETKQALRNFFCSFILQNFDPLINPLSALLGLNVFEILWLFCVYTTLQTDHTYKRFVGADGGNYLCNICKCLMIYLPIKYLCRCLLSPFLNNCILYKLLLVPHNLFPGIGKKSVYRTLKDTHYMSFQWFVELWDSRQTWSPCMCRKVIYKAFWSENK